MRRPIRHVAALGKLVSSPADALLVVRMLGWWVALPVLKRAVPLSRLVLLVQLEPGASARDVEREERVVSLVAWLFKLRPRSARDNCLERSLVAYRFLGRLNAHPELVVGIGSENDAVVGHVWVKVDGLPVLDPPDSLDAYASFVVFGSDGRPVRTAPANHGSG